MTDDATATALDSGSPPASAPSAAGELDQGHPRKWWILVAVSIGMFMGLLDVTIVNIAIPSIEGDLHASLASISWVLNAYSLMLAVFFLTMGRIGDRFGRKRVFLFGLVTFTTFSFLCGIAPDIRWLVAFRAGQGLGGAALLTVSLAIVLGVFPRRQQGTAVGIWAALGTAAAAVGPVLGGVLLNYGHWSWIFFVNVPVGIFALVVCAMVLPRGGKSVGQEGSLDIPGMLISGAGLFMLTLALVQGGEWGWTSPAILGLFAGAVISFPLFMWREVRTPSPMFPVTLLRIRSFTAANSAVMLLGLCMGGTFLLIVIYLQVVLGYTPLHAAVGMSVIPLVSLLIAPNSGRLNDRIGPRLPAAAGAGCFAVGLILLAQLSGEATLMDVIWRALFIGVGMGLAMPTLSAASMASLPPQVRGVGSGSLNTMRQVGFTIGVALLVAIFSHTMAQNAQHATKQAVGAIAANPQLSPTEKQAYAGAVVGNAKLAAKNNGSSHLTTDPMMVKGTMPPAAGTPEAATYAKVNESVAAIYRHDLAKSFTWPYYAAALAALLTIIPALLTGRRLGEHEGHDEMTREERAADRA
jgi:EmrB/QacA subfamily drug resistance transporter